MLDSILGANSAIQRIQTTGARTLHSLGVTANRATIAAAIIGVMAGVAFAVDHVGLGIVLLAVSAGLDAIDGTLARQFDGESTPFGGVMDLCFDRVVEAAVIIG